MNKLLNYLKMRRSFYVLTVLFILIYYVVLFLYGGIIDAIQYATLLCVSLLVIYFVVDFTLYYKKSQRLSYLNELDKILIDDLPLTHSPIEKQYQQLTIKLDTLHKELENQNDKDYHDMLDYFTLWVHQIKTPISALRLLIQSDQYSQQDLFMQVLRIEQYVDMALHYVKINHMAQDLKIEQYQLEDIVNEVIKKQASFFIQKKIKLELEDIHLSVLTDEKWISFVIEQILSNSLKYTKSGSIHIYVQDEVLYIKDTGLGIKEEDLPRVFEKGFTGYNGRVDKKASGLGLYLCKRVIDNLGYHIDINSILNKGTLVCIDFHVNKLDVE